MLISKALSIWSKYVLFFQFFLLMNLSCLFWNYQGAASQSFRRTFKMSVQNYKPKLVALCEPRISGIKADDFIRFNGYEYSHRVEVAGFLGGIWLLWRAGLDVTILINHKQYIHFQVSDTRGLITWVTTIYASPVTSLRKFLWKDLNYLAETIQGPWMLAGDFNATLSTSKSKGSTNSGSRPCKNFQNWFHKHGFCDLHFTGPKFTWKRGSLYKRLDRAICNDIWFNTFNKARVFHLPRLGSDHQPIFLSLNNEGTGNKCLKPFRFLASWLTDNRFSGFVSQVWKLSLIHI